MHLIDRVVQTEVDDQRINPYMEAIKEKFGGLDSDEILKRFVSVEFNRFIAYYRNAPDLNVKEKEPRGRAGRGGDRVNFSRLFINAGKKQNLNASRLLGMINENLRKNNIEIGRIDIQRKFSFFEIDSRYEADLIKSMSRASINGQSIKVDRVTGDGPTGFQRSRGRKKEPGGSNTNYGNRKRQR
jgi:ATP-dependent RNA helicase DeaD